MLKVNTGDWLSFTVATARERSLSPVHHLFITYAKRKYLFAL